MLRTDFRSLIKGYNRVKFYSGNFSRYFMPDGLFRALFRHKYDRMSADERKMFESRVDYYIRLPKDAAIDEKTAISVRDFNYPWHEKHKFTTYFFDLYECVRCFPSRLKFNYLFGDVHWETPTPTFVKSRPITSGTTNSVVLPLNKVRHFRFITDMRNFRDKKDMLVFRNVVRQPHRLAFLDRHFNNPICDAGQTNGDWGNPLAYRKPYMTIDEQLEFKFIACIEGNDVATNLKWVMASNSIAVMPRPKMETWFMEGTLKGGYHYIEIKDDYSDLDDKLKYYISHPDEAEAIIAHAHEYVARFRDTATELLTARMVAKRYFELCK
ncbi:MAG: lipopolysaccharide A protein [Duncaniella sp.]|nr:lipopolysaccharide A protein [Duncaniella sp.]